MACPAEKTRVQLVRIPSLEKYLMALIPSLIIGILTTILSSIFARAFPSLTIPSKSVAITSALTLASYNITNGFIVGIYPVLPADPLLGPSGRGGSYTGPISQFVGFFLFRLSFARVSIKNFMLNNKGGGFFFFFWDLYAGKFNSKLTKSRTSWERIKKISGIAPLQPPYPCFLPDLGGLAGAVVPLDTKVNKITNIRKIFHTSRE